jgi:hypothetical protein
MGILILISALFVAGMLWAGDNAFWVVPVAAVVWGVLLWAELRDVRVAPAVRRAVRSPRAAFSERMSGGGQLTVRAVRPRPTRPARTWLQGSH